MGGHNRISAGKAWLFAGATLFGTVAMATTAGAVEPTTPDRAPIAALTDATRDSAQLAADTLLAIDKALQSVAAIPASQPTPAATAAPQPESAGAVAPRVTIGADQATPATPVASSGADESAQASEASSEQPVTAAASESLLVDAPAVPVAPTPAATQASSPEPASPSVVAGATVALSVASTDSGETFLQTAQLNSSIVIPERAPCSANSEFLTNLRYSIQGTNTSTSDLRRLPIKGGDVVVASWDNWRSPLENCDVSLAIYRTNSARFNPSVTQQLIAYTQCLPETNIATCNPSNDGHQISVRVPSDGFFQVDFITGPPKALLGPNNGWYSGQLTKSVNRLYGARTDGQPLPLDLNTALNIAPITFDVGTSNIAAESQIELQKAVTFMTGNFDVRLEIGGHTDADGSEEGNQRLSESRATAVRDFLVAAGIESARMDAVGYGELQPIASNDTAEGKAANRRIEFIVKP